jgi:hypothetical protein
MKLVFTPGAPAEDLFARLDDTRFKLVLFGNLPRDLPAERPIDVHEILEVPTNVAALARAGIRAPCYFLLRPDGYIGLAGVKLQDGDLRRYLAERIER